MPYINQAKSKLMSNVLVEEQDNSSKLIDINSEITRFYLDFGTGFVSKGDGVLTDSYLPWEPMDPEKEEENEIEFISKLTDMYNVVGPIIYKGHTIPLYKEINAEVGDDHIFHGDAPLLFVAELVTVTDLYNVKISFKDTFISSRYGNYSETYTLKPENVSELFHPNIKEGEDIIVLDIAKIRTVLPTCSMRQKHSDTVDGKVTLLGKQSLYKTDLCGPRITLAQCFQYICLGLGKEKKFSYLPTFLGGFGSPPIFKNAKSMTRCFMTYKGGEYWNILSAICLALCRVKDTGDPVSKRFLSKVKGDAESWQDWYKVHTKYLPRIKGGLDPVVYQDGFLGTMGGDEIWDAAASRLLSAGLVCSKTQLLVHDHMEDLTKILLSSENSLSTRELIENEKKLQRQSSVFNPGFLDGIKCSVPRVLTYQHIESLLDLTRGGNLKLKFLLTSEEIFTIDALDKVKQRGPLIVNIGMTTRKGLRFPLQFETKIREEEKNYYSSLYSFIKGHVGYDEVSRKLIEDDPVLIKIASLWAKEFSEKPLNMIPLMVITTDDEKLCRTINMLYPQIVVFRITPKRSDENMKQLKQNIVSQNQRFCEIRFYDDQGSIDNWNARVVKSTGQSGFYQKVKFTLGRTIDPKSTESRRLKETRITELKIKVNGVFDQSGILSNNFRKPKAILKKNLKTMEFEYSIIEDE